jgi:hypothetical protein
MVALSPPGRGSSPAAYTGNRPTASAPASESANSCAKRSVRE